MERNSYEYQTMVHDLAAAKRASTLAEELEWQIYWRQKELNQDSQEWKFMETVFWMLNDIKNLADPNLPAKEKPQKPICEYQAEFRRIKKCDY